MKPIVFVIGACALATCGSARASVTYLTQQREVSATSFAGTTADAAPDFAPWMGDVLSFHRFSGTSAVAMQTSSLDPTGLTVQSSINAKDGQGPNGSSSFSTFDVTFSLDSDTPFQLTGDWALDWDGLRAPTAHVELQRVGTAAPLFLSVATLGATPVLSDMFDTSGSLIPGTYRLIASITQDSLDPDNVIPLTSGSLNVTLTLAPAPGALAPFAAAALCLSRRRRRHEGSAR